MANHRIVKGSNDALDPCLGLRSFARHLEVPQNHVGPHSPSLKAYPCCIALQREPPLAQEPCPCTSRAVRVGSPDPCQIEHVAIIWPDSGKIPGLRLPPMYSNPRMGPRLSLNDGANCHSAFGDGDNVGFTETSECSFAWRCPCVACRVPRCPKENLGEPCGWCQRNLPTRMTTGSRRHPSELRTFAGRHQVLASLGRLVQDGTSP